MARIPTYVSEQSATPGTSGVGSPALATPEQFGAGVGQEQQRLGQGIIALAVAGGNVGQEWEKKQQNLETENHVAKYDFYKTLLDMENAHTGDPRGFSQKVLNTFDESVDNYVNGLPVDETVRTRVKTRLMGQREAYMKSAAAFEMKSLDVRDTQDTSKALGVLYNRANIDGRIETFDALEKQAHDLIDVQPGIAELKKQNMKRAATEQLALRRFEGLERAALEATDPLALDGIRTELEQERWQKTINPKDYEMLLERVNRNIRTANTQEAVAARTAVTTLKQRNQEGVYIDPVEIEAVKSVVSKSNRPELASQLAMIEQRNNVFRDGYRMTPAQQREALEKAMKTGGVANLPEPVKRGIAGGVDITNGQISGAFLGGLFGAEYGSAADGNYGRPTGIKGPDGKPTSDAMGVAQFLSTTWLTVVRQNAEALGVDASKPDAELLKLRADPELAIKAAALYALDNKRALTRALGREPTDGELYMAHFLGTGGGPRFVLAAIQDPKGSPAASVDAGSIAANKPVFYGPDGKLLTNAQVMLNMTQKVMNGPSRVDYSLAKAWQTVGSKTIKALADDMIAFAQQHDVVGPVGDITTVEGMQQRGVAARKIADFYGVPIDKMRPFSKTETEALATKARDGTAEETLQVMQQIQGLGSPDMIRAANKQIGEKNDVFNHAAGLAYGDQKQFGVAADIIRGEKRMKQDKDVVASMGASEPQRIEAFNRIVGKALIGTTEGTAIRKAADAYYVQRYLVQGGARQGSFDASSGGWGGDSDYAKSIHAVLGGAGNPDGKAFGSVNGAMTALPRGVSAAQFQSVLPKMTIEDYTALSVFGGSPRYQNGDIAKPDEIAREGTFVATGAGQYIIHMADGKPLITARYADKSAHNYVFRGDPERLLAILTRLPPVPFNPAAPPARGQPGAIANPPLSEPPPPPLAQPTPSGMPPAIGQPGAGPRRRP